MAVVTLQSMTNSSALILVENFNLSIARDITQGLKPFSSRQNSIHLFFGQWQHVSQVRTFALPALLRQQLDACHVPTVHCICQRSIFIDVSRAAVYPQL